MTLFNTLLWQFASLMYVFMRSAYSPSLAVRLGPLRLSPARKIAMFSEEIRLGLPHF